MSTGSHRVITFALIATLIPAPGLAWRAPVFHRPAADAAIGLVAQRVFAEALNTPHQVGFAGSGRPQIYLVYELNVAVPSATPPAVMTAASLAWVETFLAELVKQPVTGTATATATAPTDSILDELDPDDAVARSMQTAKALASMPNSLPFEANPNESVPVERSMSVAIKDALQEAGLDNPDNNGSTTFKRGTGTVTYEGEFADGDIVVTGRLVDGRIVLTKEFKPLTVGGDVGDPVRIRAVGPPAATGTQTSGTQTATPNVQTATATTAEVPVAVQTPATPQPSYNDTLRLQLEVKVKTITPNQTPAVVMGQILVRDTYVLQVNSLAANLEALLQNPAQLDALTLDLRRGAEAVDSAYQNMLGAEQNVAIVQGRNPRADQKLQYDNDMRSAATLEEKGDKAGADRIRQAAHDTAYGNFIEKQRIFFAALDENPLLGLGSRGWFLFPDDFLFKALRNTLSYNAPNSEYVTIVSGYLQTALEEAREEATRAAGVNTVEDLTEFGGGKYERTRATMAAEGQANGSTLPGLLAYAAEGHYEMVEGGKAVTTVIANFGLNLVAGTFWVFPGIGPFIAGGAAAIQVVREGNDLYIAVLDAEDARNLAGVTGYTRVLTAEDKVAAERGEFVLAVAGLALEGLTAIKIVKGPLPSGAGNTAADATTTAARNTPPPGAAPAPGTAPKPGTPNTPATAPKPGATSTPEPAPSAFKDSPVLPEVRDADGKVVGAKTTRISQAEIDAGDLEDLKELQQIYDTNLANARAAGVSEQRIKEIIGDGTVNADAADNLYRESLKGKQTNMPAGEYRTAAGIDVRNQTGNLTEADYQLIRDRLAKDPNYIDRLPDRGRMPQGDDLGDGFSPVVTAEGRDALLKNPRIAQMVDDAKTAAGAGTINLPPGTAAAADNTGTVILPPGSQPGIAGVADNTGTVILPPGAKPGPGNPTVRMDPDKTALVDNADTTPTVRLDPNKTTVDPNGTMLDPNKTTIDPNKTVITDPNKTSLIPPPNPATRVDPNKTVTMDPNKTALVDNADTTPTVRLDSNKTTLDPNKTALIDPNATTRMADELILSLPKAQQSGLSPRQVAGNVPTTLIRPGEFAVSNSNVENNRITSVVPSDSCSGGDCFEIDTCSGGSCGVDSPLIPEPPGGPDFRYQSMGGELEPLRVNASGSVAFLQPPPQMAARRLNPLGLLARSIHEFLEWWSPTVHAAEEPLTLEQASRVPGGLQFLVTSLGGSTGKVLAMQVLNFTGKPINLQGMLALEPLKTDAQQRVTQAFSRLAGKALPGRVDLRGYCLEFLKLPPVAGQLMTVAAPAAQKRFAPLKQVMAAVNRLKRAGQLRPDSAPDSYGDSIKQWAVWTVEQKFNQARFTDAFAAHTKKNIEAAGQQWSRQAEDVIRKVSPNRWQDIVKVLAGAGMQPSQ